MQTFEKTTAFITGAASGIGLALTKALTAQGANVMMADINRLTLEPAAEQVGRKAGQYSTQRLAMDHRH